MFRNYTIVENLKIGLGPELGYLMAAKAKLGGNSNDVDFAYDKKLELGIDANLEYQPFAFLTTGLRYNYGLTNVFSKDVQITDAQGNPSDVNPKLHNRVLQVYVGYIINWNKD